MNEKKGYKKLKVWEKAHKLAIEDLQSQQGISERGVVWADIANQKGWVFSSFKHCGRACK